MLRASPRRAERPTGAAVEPAVPVVGLTGGMGAGKSTALIIGETESAVTDLFAQNAVLFGQVFDGPLLMLIEPERQATRKENGVRNADMLGAYHSGLTCLFHVFNTLEFCTLRQEPPAWAGGSCLYSRGQLTY